MKFIVKDMDIETGGPLIAIINKKDAKFLDLHNGDRVRLNYRRNIAIAIIDIAESKKAVPSGKIGCFEELLKELKVKGKYKISLQLVEKPKSIDFIRRKLDGETLNEKEITQIIKDIVDNRLSEAELAYFVSAFYTFDNTYLLTLLGNLELVQKIKTGNAVIKYDKRRLQRKVGFWGISKVQRLRI